MKRCPTCKRTFEDSLTYCLIDGSVLSPPFEEDEPDLESRVTEVLPESPRVTQPTQPVPPPQTTIAAALEPPRDSPSAELTTVESKPVGLMALIGLVTIFYFVGIVILLMINWKTVSPFFGWLLVRRIPAFLMLFIGIIVALARIRYHVRASLLTILALIIYVLEGLFFYLFTSSAITVMSKMKLSPSVGEWVYFLMYFAEDFIYAAVIVLLVAAAFNGRSEFSKLTETS